MSRATRIYIAIDYSGEPVLSRTVKYEMKYAIEEAEKRGLRTDLWKYWSVPDNNRNEIKQVTKSFFTGYDGY
jgi:hypothetical protein